MHKIDYEVDLLIAKGRQFTAIEIKSGQTFQPEFIAGIQHFQKVFQPDLAVAGRVWYNGSQKTAYQDMQVCNPLLYGFTP